MNRNDTNSNSNSTSNNDKRDAKSPSTIQGDASSRDASSGKSAFGREPQQGSAVDNSTAKRDASRTDGSAKR